MGYIVSASIPDEHREFLNEKQLSPSTLIQEKIVDLMKLQPEEYQTEIRKYEKKKDHQTTWQKGLNEEPDFEKRKAIVFKFLDSIRVDTTDWVERIENDNKIRKAGLGENEGPSNRDEQTGSNEPDCFE